MTVIKRERETNNAKESIDYLANTLMLLSSAIELKSSEKFECKTCGRKFASFQALGGHRTSHKRQKHNGDHGDEQQLKSEAKKPKKMHECSICGMGFSLGQQLGGHMRKHRENNNNNNNRATIGNNKGFSSNPINHAVVNVPVLKRSNSKRVICMDLNLTPLENDLKLLFGNKAPRVDLSLF